MSFLCIVMNISICKGEGFIAQLACLVIYLFIYFSSKSHFSITLSMGNCIHMLASIGKVGFHCLIFFESFWREWSHPSIFLSHAFLCPTIVVQNWDMAGPGEKLTPLFAFLLVDSSSISTRWNASRGFDHIVVCQIHMVGFSRPLLWIILESEVTSRKYEKYLTFTNI